MPFDESPHSLVLLRGSLRQRRVPILYEMQFTGPTVAEPFDLWWDGPERAIFDTFEIPALAKGTGERVDCRVVDVDVPEHRPRTKAR